MSELALASVFAVFIWWFSTGLVLLLDRLPHGALRWGHWLSSLLALAVRYWFSAILYWLPSTVAFIVKLVASAAAVPPASTVMPRGTTKPRSTSPVAESHSQ